MSPTEISNTPIVPATGSGRRSWLRWTAIALVAYALFVFTAFSLEGYSRQRFGIRPRHEIDAIRDHKEKVQAEIVRMKALDDRGEWAPYAAFEIFGVTLGFGLMIAGGFFVGRSLIRSARLSGHYGIKLIAIGILLAASAGLAAGFLPLELSAHYYDGQSASAPK